MKIFPFVFLLPLLLLSPAEASENDGAEKKPGFLQRLNPFRRSGGEKDAAGATTQWNKLELKMTLEPLPVKLGETRQVKVLLLLTNKGKRFVQLEFPTTQRIEVVVRKQDGKLVEQWSEDQAFTNEPSVVAVNPGERLEYAASVATRDMTAGETYVVEAFFPNYEQLRVQTLLTPEP